MPPADPQRMPRYWPRRKETLGQGCKIRVEGILPRGSQGGNGTAVEAILQGDDMVVLRALFASGPQARALDGALIGLRARIGEKHGLSTRTGAELFGQARAGLMVIEV